MKIFLTSLLTVACLPYLNAQSKLPPGAVARFGSDAMRHDKCLAALFSPDGATLITAGQDIHIWDVKARRLVRTIPVKGTFIRQLQLSADGKTLFAAPDHTAGVASFDVASGKELTPLPTKAGACTTAFAVAPDGKTLAVGHFASVNAATGECKSELILYKAASAEAIALLTGPRRKNSLDDRFKDHLRIDGIVYSKDGKLVACSCGDQDDAVRVFDIATGNERHALRRHDYVWEMAVTPEGRLAVVSSPESMRFDNSVLTIWNMQTGKVESETAKPPGCWFVSFSPDGKWAAGLDRWMVARVWDRATGKVRYAGRQHPSGGPLSFSKDGNLLVACRGAYFELIDLDAGRDVLLDEGHTGKVRTLDISSDGQTIASGGEDGVIFLWDTKTGAMRRLFHMNGSGAMSVAFAPNGRTLATTSYLGDVMLWDVASGKELHRLNMRRPPTDPYRHGTRVGFSIDGKTLGVAGSSGPAYEFFETETGKPHPTLTRNFGADLNRPAPFRFSPDGRHFAGVYTSGDATVRVALWNLGDKLPALIGPEATSILDLAFSSDGEYVAWSENNVVRVWDVREKKELKALKDAAPGSLAFSPDGRYLASGKTLHPLDAKHPALELPLRPGPLAFSRDGGMLVVTPAEGYTLLVFDPKKLTR